MHVTVAAYREIMNKNWRRCVSLGRTELWVSPQDYYGFSAFEMLCVHYHCMGIGQGTWFRLTDGRVFDWQGQRADPDVSLYDTMTLN
jgi:hypothetical protein